MSYKPQPDRVIIRLAFPHPVYGTFTPIKVEYEYPLGPTDDDQDALDDGKKRAEEWFTSRYPALDTGYQPTATIEKERRPTDTVAALIADIYSCTELKVLESYRIVAKQKPELQAAYDQMFEKLSK